MAVKVIWDISVIFINFEIIPSVNVGDFEIDKNNKGYPKSHEQLRDS